MISHIILMRERLEGMSTPAQGNLRKAKENQNTWYDWTARERILTPGESVLVFLPTSMSKLLDQWHGPYEVVCQAERVNYLVAMPERRKEGTIHIYMLRKWKEPSGAGYFVTEAMDGEEELETLMWDGEEAGSQPLGSICWTSREEHLRKC